jgi:hypothetical protein
LDLLRDAWGLSPHEQEVESPDERSGHRDIDIYEIGRHDDMRSGIFIVKIPESI